MQLSFSKVAKPGPVGAEGNLEVGREDGTTYLSPVVYAIPYAVVAAADSVEETRALQQQCRDIILAAYSPKRHPSIWVCTVDRQ